MATPGSGGPTGGASVPASLVSIVIPTRNYAGYVGQAIRSGLHQGYRPIEIVVVDDGSTDDTPAVLREFEGAIRVVRLEGLGVSAARNAGLAQARGEYVVLLDADDLLVPGGVAAQVAQFDRRPDIDAVVGEWYTYDVQCGTITEERSSLKDDDALSHLLRTNIVATPSAMMVRRTAVSALGGFDTSFSFTADWEMWWRLAKQGCRFARVTAPVATYRIHGRSMTSNLDRAIRDGTALLDRCFNDPALSEAMRAVEPRSRFGMMMYLAELCLQQGDDHRGGECLREALRWNPQAVDTLAFYRSLADAMSRAGRRGGRDVATVVHSMLALCAELDDGRRRRRRQALRHLAAGMIARNADAGGLRLHHLRVAVGASWRTVLMPPQLSWSVRLLLRRGLIEAARSILATIGLIPRASVPAAVRAMVTAGSESGLRPGRRGEMGRGGGTEP
jgi:glycosyltransferase involved in cell wall biosynthesis